MYLIQVGWPRESNVFPHHAESGCSAAVALITHAAPSLHPLLTVAYPLLRRRSLQLSCTAIPFPQFEGGKADSGTREQRSKTISYISEIPSFELERVRRY